MSDKERELAIKKLRNQRTEALRSKESATNFLIKVGIITEKGNLRKPYK